MTLLPWLVVGFLVLVNALYVAAEFAAVAVQRSELARMADDGHARAARLLAILADGHELDRYIAACQIGITLSSLLLGAYGQATIAVELVPILVSRFGLEPLHATSAAAVAVLLLLSALQVVLSELTPKSLALQFPERTALLTFLPTSWSVTVYSPFIWLLNGSGLLLLRPFGIRQGGHQHVHSPDEIAFMLGESHRGGALTPEAHGRLRQGLRLSHRTVKEVMVPRGDMVAIEASTPPEEVVRQILQSPYSTLPVYRETLDQMLGVVITKDLVGQYAEHGVMPRLEDRLRPALFVPESITADRLVLVLREQRSSKAIVMDEYGSVQGFVSIADVLMALFGEIGDELKDSGPGAERLEDGTIRLPGWLSLEDAEIWLGASWEGSAATVGGHIVHHLGRLPKRGEDLEIDGVKLTVVEMSPTAVLWVRIRPPTEIVA